MLKNPKTNREIFPQKGVFASCCYACKKCSKEWEYEELFKGRACPKCKEEVFLF